MDITKLDNDDAMSLASAMTQMARAGDNIATTLLATIPQNRTTDEQLLLEYPTEEFMDLEEEDEEAPLGHHSNSSHNGEIYLKETSAGMEHEANDHGGEMQEEEGAENKANAECHVLDRAYPNTTIEGGPLDLQVYLTAKNPPPGMPPFVHYGRPDVKGLFQKLRDDAIEAGERRVAVCVCAPMRLVNLCRKACAKYSDRRVAFDFHFEVFE
uniref:Ferric reductase NAD binding domain-containing protein n=1 Tax=Cyclophora tenuis TaxID=216820 RepID=A0A7S1D076_CYCTE|mmetsp:Transcript_16988/g.28857  ORF Transcript_16988/g.28857 Transcript_16988/m.28857 type:complete len:212 (+) Transcript_16988:3-638(+)